MAVELHFQVFSSAIRWVSEAADGALSTRIEVTLRGTGNQGAVVVAFGDGPEGIEIGAEHTTVSLSIDRFATFRSALEYCVALPGPTTVELSDTSGSPSFSFHSV